MRRRLGTTCLLLLLAFVSASVAAAPLPGEAAIAQLNRAESLIAQQDAAGRSAFALLGVLTEDDRALLATAITEAAELTDAASVAIDRAIEQIDSMAEPDEAHAQRRFALAIERRELRLPLARARAASILAALQPDDRTRTALATTAVNALHKVTLNGAAIDTRGAVIAGEALLLLGDAEKALASFATAIERAQSGAGDDQPSAMDLAEARLGRALAIAQTDGDHDARLALSDLRNAYPFVTDAAPSPLLALLRADVAVRLDRESGAKPYAINGYLEALVAAPSASVYRSLRAVILARLAALWAEEAWTPASAPPLALVVRALSLADEDPSSATAANTLRRLLDRSDELDTIELAEARLALAELETDSNPRRAMLLLLEIAESEDRNAPRLAPEALRRAYEIGSAQAHTDLSDPVTALFDRTIAVLIDRAEDQQRRVALWLRRAALFEALGANDKAVLAYDQIPDSSDRWLGAQRRAVSLEVRGLLQHAESGAAKALLERVDPLLLRPIDDDFRELLAASKAIALTRMGRHEPAVLVVERLPSEAVGFELMANLAILGLLEPLEYMLFDAELRGDSAAQQAAAGLLLRVVDSQRVRSEPLSRERRRARGLALLYSGEADEAASEFRALQSERADPRLDVWLAEALLASGDAEGAFALYRRVAEGLEADGATADPDFWRCWSRMLRVLADQSEAERNDEQLLVQINRLAILDPGFGGEPFKRRIEAVRRAVPAHNQADREESVGSGL